MVRTIERTGSIWGALLVLGLFALYFPGLHNELVFDDGMLANGQLQESYGSLLAFKQRMLSYGSFVWLDALVGEGWWKQRLFNLALHIGVVFALYALFRALVAHVQWPDELRDEPHFEASRLAALRVGITLFAFNPVAVYAVAYLIQRSILGATLFVVMACLAFVKGVTSGRSAWYLAAFASYLAALLCKEYALMAPALAVPLYIFLKRPGWKQSAAIIGGSVALVAGVISLLLGVYGEIIGVPFDELSKIYVMQLQALDPAIEEHAWPLSILNQAALFFYYGFLWFVPNIFSMSIDMRPPFPLSFASWPQLAGAVAYVLLLLGAAWLLLKRSGPAGFAGLCLLFPVLLFATEFSTVWIQDPFVLYRSYLWAIAVPGLAMLLFVGARPRTIYTIGLVVAVGLAGLALDRVLSFKHTLSVWSDAVDKIDPNAPANAVGRWRPFLNRGSYYLENMMPEAAYPDFARADALGELQGSASFNMGVSLQLMKRYDEAIKALNIAEKRGFRDAGVYYHRAESGMALGRFEPALKDLSRAIELTPDAHFGRHVRTRRAEAALKGGRYDVARDDFAELMTGEGDDYRYRLGLAMALVGLRDGAAALPHFDALIAKQSHPSAHYGRALALRLLGRPADAAIELKRAIALDPKNSVYQNLYAQIGDRY